ncbi:MAG: HAMP domain-containing histidine kinase [Tissierellia bacterium]|nr:HAMP domain-containing histidine kinase [Tissierellia bacterium]
MVIISIRIKMLIIYSLIAVLVFSIFGVLVLNNYKSKQIKNEEIRLFQTANIVADTYKGNMEDIIFARIMVKSYGKQANARILVVDANKKVLIDNYNSYIGKTLDNDEIKSSLKGKSKSGLYNIEQKNVLQLSVPITMNTGLETKVIGAVLISASMESIYSDIENLKKDILKISSFALTISIVLTAIATNSITKPLRNLSYGVKRIASGDLGYKVNKGSRDEIGQLVDSFNNMSHRLYSIEKNRKDFINSISHELKTPLTSIRALIESLSIGNNDLETYDEYLMDIYEETKRMEDLVNYLMGSLKLEDIILDINKEDIGQIIDETVKLMEPYAEKNNVKLQLNNEVKGIVVKCDKNRVKEVLINLIDNSIKYKDEKKNYHFISIIGRNNGDNITLIIEDNGLGIKKEDLTNLFERGFRVLEGHVPNDKSIAGYGIGLALVKNIIDKHGWSISAKSTISQGSTFTITIPV